MHNHNTTSLPKPPINQIPLFDGLSTADRQTLLDAGKLVAISPGEVIIEQGTNSHRLWILVDGQCEVLLDVPPRRTPFLLASLEPTTCFGEMSFFSDAPHSASVVARTAVSLVQFDREAFDRVTKTHPAVACQVAQNVIRSLSERMRRMDQWVADLALKTDHAPRVDELNQLRDKLFGDWKI